MPMTVTYWQISLIQLALSAVVGRFFGGWLGWGVAAWIFVHGLANMAYGAIETWDYVDEKYAAAPPSPKIMSVDRIKND